MDVAGVLLYQPDVSWTGDGGNEPFLLENARVANARVLVAVGGGHVADSLARSKISH